MLHFFVYQHDHGGSGLLLEREALQHKDLTIISDEHLSNTTLEYGTEGLTQKVSAGTKLCIACMSLQGANLRTTLQVPVTAGYMQHAVRWALLLQVYFMMHHAVTSFDPQYIMKADDDTYVNLPVVMNLLQHFPTDKDLYAGHQRYKILHMNVCCHFTLLVEPPFGVCKGISGLIVVPHYGTMRCNLSRGALGHLALDCLCDARRYLEDLDDTSELMAQYKADTDGKAPCHAYMDGPAYILSKVQAHSQLLHCAVCACPVTTVLAFILCAIMSDAWGMYKM